MIKSGNKNYYKSHIVHKNWLGQTKQIDVFYDYSNLPCLLKNYKNVKITTENGRIVVDVL